MFTSFIPYLLLSPTYINILNMYVTYRPCPGNSLKLLLYVSYAFANLDDVRSSKPDPFLRR